MLDPAPAADPPPEATTGLPGIRAWRGVYVVVCLVFALWVVLLSILPRLFA